MKKLSICIPSYNRFAAVQETLREIFQVQSKDFDVFVIDNGSKEDITEAIQCSNSRLHLIKREKTVYGAYNVSTCVEFGDGEYVMLLLDKDTVTATGLEKFLTYLSELPPNTQGGYCALDVDLDTAEGGGLEEENAILKFGYINKHPSGDFFRRTTVQRAIQQLPEKLKGHAFGFEFLLAACAANGAMAVFQQPFIRTEEVNHLPGKDTKSLSFRKEDNTIFFYPENRIQTMIDYIEHLGTLDVPADVYEKMLSRLYYEGLHSATFEYRGFMKTPKVCYHYRLEMQDVSDEEMDAWEEKTRVAFHKLPIDETVKRKASAEAERKFQRVKRKERRKNMKKKIISWLKTRMKL